MKSYDPFSEAENMINLAKISHHSCIIHSLLLSMGWV